MRQISLCTAAREFVAIVEVPPFPDAGLPGVVIWGSRTFVRDGFDSGGTPSHPPRPLYREAFATVSFTPSPGLAVADYDPEIRRQDATASAAAAAIDAEVQRLAAESAPASTPLVLGGPDARTFPRPGTPPPVDRSAVTTLHGTPIGEHTAIGADGMQADYVVLTAEERAKGFVRPVRRSYRHEKCGTVTTMGQALAETYAREPSFYSGTYCCGCRAHFPVGAAGEFTWEGTNEKVGT